MLPFKRNTVANRKKSKIFSWFLSFRLKSKKSNESQKVLS